MKKSIAAVIISSFASLSASAVTIYDEDDLSFNLGGRLEGRAATEDGEIIDYSRVRLNLTGKWDFHNDWYGIGFFEHEYKSAGDGSDHGNVNVRHLMSGVGNDNYGRLVFGKTDGSLGILTDFTDILFFHGNEAGKKLHAGDRSGNNLAYFGTFGENDNLLIKANYVFGNGFPDDVNDGTSAGAVLQGSDGYSLSTVYSFDNGIKVGLGYGEQGQINATTQEVEPTATQLFATASYIVGDLYIAALYQNSENHYKLENGDFSSDTVGYELTAAYNIDKFRLTATHNYVEDKAENETLNDMVALEAAYYFTPKFRPYVSYKHEMLDNEDSENQVAAGVRFDF
ncbi:porin [Psychromonas aquimarina]|uniref:porin n=1 Tax=Psychromonas aquimarina TaxID=444919 RepID=UPI00048DEC2D|nr:porin [Psychromonas aquimarina]